ncbi:MAG: amidohydrolase family protein [Rhizobiales bacterium]|nr:amidohydrolase family protein [Hyphomicrobiales bacterium]
MPEAEKRDIPGCPPPREPTPPQVPLPPNACDTHAHVFGPATAFPYAVDRSYTPPDAPLAKYLGMLDTRLRGVAVADASTPAATLRDWHERGVRGLRFNHFFRGGQLHYRGGVPLDDARKLAGAMRDLGWHMQLWVDVKDLPETAPILAAIGLPVVIDHMGRTDARAGTGSPGFQSLVRLAGEGKAWVKLSGAHRLSLDAPDYPDAKPFHEALVRANPERLVWGTDWPHPRIESAMPDAGHLLDLFTEWTPDAAIRRRILVDNPVALYDF